VNASVDHVFLVSQKPELLGSLDNVEWVDFQVNRMKTDMTHKEFPETCLQIVEHTGIGKRT
jgi:hypothetical protein